MKYKDESTTKLVYSTDARQCQVHVQVKYSELEPIISPWDGSGRKRRTADINSQQPQHTMVSGLAFNYSSVTAAR